MIDALIICGNKYANDRYKFNYYRDFFRFYKKSLYALSILLLVYSPYSSASERLILSAIYDFKKPYKEHPGLIEEKNNLTNIQMVKKLMLSRGTSRK